MKQTKRETEKALINMGFKRCEECGKVGLGGVELEDQRGPFWICDNCIYFYKDKVI